MTDGPVERLLERLNGVRKSGDGWTALCPVHEGDGRKHRPSLSVGEGENGGAVINCFAGCATGDVLASVGMTLADLFPAERGRSASSDPDATYDYLDEMGRLLFQVCRYPGKRFLQRRPDGNGDWIWKLGDTRLVVYRLDKIASPEVDRTGETLYVVEGEKDVHAVEHVGGIATCNPGGAGKWRNQYAEMLRGFGHVVVVADRDAPGELHAKQVAESLGRAGLSAEIVQAAIGKDAADHLAAGRTLGELEPLALAPDLPTVVEGLTAGRTDRRLLPSPSAPMAVARELVQERYSDRSGLLTLRHWRGGWWEWRRARWLEVEQRAMAAAGYAFTEHAVCEKDDELQPWAPTRHKIVDLLDALAAVVHTPEDTAMPGWLDGTVYDGMLVSCANGLLDVGRRELREHTPRFFNATSVPFEYDPAAHPPRRWIGFMNELWPSDGDSVSALQEWFGYVVSGRLDLHKIMLLVGPTRAGKGVTARILGALVGDENVAGPTLSSLNGEFGLAPLLGKTLAVVSDARLNGRHASVVVERLLSISGEDSLTVNRKYREQWTGKLPTRLMLCSNELPQLGDASMAIAGRFVPLLLTRSWLGHEDHDLEPALRLELTGILNWALDGLGRLAADGRFTRPPGADEAMVALQDLASPVAAFVRDRCVRDPKLEIAVDDLYTAWRSWAEDNGHAKSTKQVFGRDLRAAIPGLRVARPRDGAERERVYKGVALRGADPSGG